VVVFGLDAMEFCDV